MQIYQLDSPAILQRHLARHLKIYQMIDDAQGNAHWQPATNSNHDYDSQHPPISSAKTLFFSEQENLFTFDGECFRETLPTPEPFAVFGVHSCDLTAIAYQDKFFADDPYYQARRQQALLVGVDCISPCENGFCHAVDAGPGVTSECADLILHHRHNDDWLVLVCNDRGVQAIHGLALTLADEQAFSHREQTLNQCKQKFEECTYISEGVRALNQDKAPDEFWQQVGLQCLACSGCTILCPTCSCYGTREQIDDKGVRQQRFWDSCLYESFQREASQHNPSLDAGQRVQRFWKHKFGDGFVDTFDRYGCVGCGRCEETCPGVIGAHSIMKRLSNYA